MRGPILASWRRSRDRDLAADQIELPYVQDPDTDTPLTRSAEPVLRHLCEQLDGQPVSVVLTDPSGLVLLRLTADSQLQRHLDHVQLAPGFSYGEHYAGTNGIGTALVTGKPTEVIGPEHYVESLENLACAGVPVRHPVSGRTVGAVDLTCWRKDAGPLLLTLAKTTAEQIRQQMLTETGSNHLELFHEYMRTCHRTAGVVFAVNHNMAMLNDYARATLDPADQAALLSHAAELLGNGSRVSTVVELPTGITARMHCRPVRENGKVAGLVAHAKLGEPDHRHNLTSSDPVRMPLPGLVGYAPLWLRACHETERVVRSGEWLALEGEPGVGKTALLRAAQSRQQPDRRLVLLDAADASTNLEWFAGASQALLRRDHSLVVRHVDRLRPAQLRELGALLREAATVERAQPLWVGLTLERVSEGRELNRLLGLFPRTVEVPPLRLHMEDLPQLVALFLSRLQHGADLTCAPETMRLLMRSSWPGNAAQVLQVLRQVAQRRRSGVIQPEDLPPAAQTVSRRLLSPLESMERDAIVQALNDARGNKAATAHALGMSRATIYRKIHDYGIVPPVG
ncbi:helix-turn-helix domain-containing protein [Rhodococcus sp. X156]|uniref:sigma-54-dependent Fis family transcriptional regulator n=1 Tax=Rhodococcus sp. X156 TaxID=2499145 RepID=UPI0019CF4F29|nr:helix-turn-helix domain-containing protein [Rhodococcus sp. X156]